MGALIAMHAHRLKRQRPSYLVSTTIGHPPLVEDGGSLPAGGDAINFSQGGVSSNMGFVEFWCVSYLWHSRSAPKYAM